MPTRDTLGSGSGVMHPAINTSKPNVARVYDYLLGGRFP